MLRNFQSKSSFVNQQLHYKPLRKKDPILAVMGEFGGTGLLLSLMLLWAAKGKMLCIFLKKYN